MNRLLLAAVWSLWGWHAQAAAEAVPGGVVELLLQDAGAEPPIVYYGNRPVLVRQVGGRWQALVAIDLDTAPGDYVIRIETTDEDPVHRTLTIRPRRKPPALYQAARGEEVSDDGSYPPPAPPPPKQAWRPELDAALPLSFPFDESVVMSHDRLYGSRELLTDDNYRWRVGLELAISNNSRVNAPGAGVVFAVVAAGPKAFAVHVDHGMGLFSGIYPVTEVQVQPGTRVLRGALLGRLYHPVGEGPVLTTWTLRMNGTYVDPLRFARQAGPVAPAGN